MQPRRRPEPGAASRAAAFRSKGTKRDKAVVDVRRSVFADAIPSCPALLPRTEPGRSAAYRRHMEPGTKGPPTPDL